MPNPNQRSQFAFLFLGIALFFGFIVRIWPAIVAGTPINDGGLFYQMTQELAENNYRLPLFTTYNQNQLHLPYVYPPLGFYTGALVQQVSGFQLYLLFRYLPGVLATLTIPAMYFFSLQMLKDKTRAAIAALFYATLPISFVFLNTGGGINRSLGMIFAILTMGTVVQLFTTKKWAFVIPISIFGSLLVLSHPESAYHTVLNGILFWLVFGRDRKTFIQSLAAAILIIIVTCPWWIFVIQHHGFAPYLTAIRDQLRDPATPLRIFQFNLTGEPLLTVIGVLAAIGLLISLGKRKFFLPGWILFSFLTSQRAGPFSSIFPLIFLAVEGFEFLIKAQENPSSLAIQFQNSRALRLTWLVLIAYNFMSGILVGLWFGNEQRLLPEEINNLQWIAHETPQSSRFLVLTGLNGPDDSLSEWFPALTQRTSLATIQGHEWTEEKSITPALKDYWQLQACLNQQPDCLQQWASKTNLQFDYIYIRKINLTKSGAILKETGGLQRALRESRDYQIIYDSETAVIFAPADTENR